MHPDYTWLEDILISARKIQRAVEGLTQTGFEADEYRVLSVERLLEIIGEAAKQVSDPFRSQHPEIPWRQMAGMRDILIHAYRKINRAEIWKAVSISIPALITAIEPLIPYDNDASEQGAAEP
jgi:uncharacterized protein with HEPN domain